ncbi:MAG: nucleotidyltransferase [Armatimonadota bacterium]|nr:nucleotidyltransferase [Armatimonadota bacterium]
MTQLPPDFKEFLQLLNSKGVEYLLVGGYAVGYHGYPRTTGDMDVWVAIHPQNAEKIVEALKEFGFGLPDLSPDLFLQKERIVRMGIPPFRIEVFTTISGVNFEECYAQRVVDVIDGVEVNIINLEYLKLNKQASGRPKDVNDLQNLP